MSAALTPKQEAFAQAVSQGMSASAAYRAAYRATGMSESAVWLEASRLRNHPKVTLRIELLLAGSRNKAEHRLALSKEWVLRGLMDTIAEARAAVPVLDHQGNQIGQYRKNLGAAVRGYELIGKHLGMFVDKKEIRTGSLEGLNEDELERRIEELSLELGIENPFRKKRLQ